MDGIAGQAVQNAKAIDVNLNKAEIKWINKELEIIILE
jgi:hypothetical protein